jgi:hypothetical protein
VRRTAKKKASIRRRGKEETRKLTSSVGQLVGGMREDVVEPREETVRVAVRTDRVTQRVRLSRIESMARTNTPSQHADGDGQPRHRPLDDLLDTLRATRVRPRLRNGLAPVHAPQLVSRSESRAEGEGRGFRKVGGTVAARSSVRDRGGGPVLASCADEGVGSTGGCELRAGTETGEGTTTPARGRVGGS